MSIGILQLLLILLIIMLLFGAGKLPKVMGDLAKGLKSFKNELNSDDTKNQNLHTDNKKNTKHRNKK